MDEREGSPLSSGHYDSIVIGAGHNGLTCAAYLARAGHRVLVLESADDVGGLAAVREFHPGFRVSVPHTVTHFSPKVVRDLGLAKHGFSGSSHALRTTGFGEDGRPLTVDNESLSGASSADTAAYGEYSRLMRRFAGKLEPFWQKTMPRIGEGIGLSGMATFAHLGLNLRRLGKNDMEEFLRVASLPMRDLMDEYFEDEVLKVVLSWDGLIGSKLAPRSPNNPVLTILYRMAGRQGGTGLIEALRAASEAAGVEIRTDSPVARVQIDANSAGLEASGVRLQSGETITANHVVSSTDPKTTFLGLVGAEHLEIGFTNRIRRLRSDGYVGKLHLALGDLPRFEGLENPDGRLILAPDLDAIEHAFDDAKYGAGSESPVMEVVLPSLRDGSLAPAGQHVLSAHVMYVPYRMKGGWSDAAREAMCERAIDTIERYAPGIRDLILHREFLAPVDLERMYGVTGGHWHHTEMAADQLLMMRPTYEAAQYRTPIPGLYLCGAGCHPAGDLTGMPGRNAAREILP